MRTKRDVSSDQLARVAAVVGEALSGGDIPETLQTLIDGVVELTGADRAAVLLEQHDFLLSCYADRGSDGVVGRELPLEGSLEGVCYRMRAPVISDDITRDGRFAAFQKAADEVSLIAIPLHLEGPPIGLIRVTCGEAGRFGGRELITTRLVAAAMRKVLLQRLRAEREALGIYEKDFTTAGVWALRNLRKIQLERSVTEGACVSLVRYDIRGYLTADIVDHVSAVLRSGDHVFQDDVGTFTLILTGTPAADAEIVARRVTAEIQRIAEIDGHAIEVAWTVTQLDASPEQRRIA